MSRCSPSAWLKGELAKTRLFEAVGGTVGDQVCECSGSGLHGGERVLCI